MPHPGTHEFAVKLRAKVSSDAFTRLGPGHVVRGVETAQALLRHRRGLHGPACPLALSPRPLPLRVAAGMRQRGERQTHHQPRWHPALRKHHSQPSNLASRRPPSAAPAWSVPPQPPAALPCSPRLQIRTALLHPAPAPRAPCKVRYRLCKIRSGCCILRLQLHGLHSALLNAAPPPRPTSGRCPAASP